MLDDDGFQQFKDLAFIDPLTQTREYDYVRAQVPEWNQKYSKGGNASLISARGLKLINDALGHKAGDRYLKALGRELRQIVFQQRAKGNWLEDSARIASKDFLIVGNDSPAVGRALQKAMARVMAGTEVLNAAEKAQVAELARTRGENPALTGTLRVVGRDLATGEDGKANIFGTIDSLIALSEQAKQKEQPTPPAPKAVKTK
jgi:GGDEF domain-containing protein